MVSDAGQHCIAPNPPHDQGLLAEQMVKDTLAAIEAKSGGTFEYRLKNNNRSIGARLSGEIAKRHGNLGMSEHPITLKLKGTAGQSFGVWNAGGLHLELEGDANDYVGKGMAGGRIIVKPPKGSRFKTQDSAIIGNTAVRRDRRLAVPRPASPASVSRCATPARWRWSRAAAITAAST